MCIRDSDYVLHDLPCQQRLLPSWQCLQSEYLKTLYPYIDKDVYKRQQQRHKDEAQQKMTALCMEWFPQEVENLQTIPGVKERSATSIIAVSYTHLLEKSVRKQRYQNRVATENRCRAG